MTDELVRLRRDDDVLMEVLAHDLVHLQQRRRHPTRNRIQGSAVAATAALLFGEVSGLISSIPPLVLDLKYSSDIELETDDYAIVMFKANGISLKKLAYTFEKLDSEPTSFLNLSSTHPLCQQRSPISITSNIRVSVSSRKNRFGAIRRCRSSWLSFMMDMHSINLSRSIRSTVRACVRFASIRTIANLAITRVICASCAHWVLPASACTIRVNTAKYKDEVLSFLDASDFRGLGKDQNYDLSARDLAIDTSLSSSEEFSCFTEFWIERLEAGAKELTIYELLNSRRVNGAYRFILKPSGDNAIAVNA